MPAHLHLVQVSLAGKSEHGVLESLPCIVSFLIASLSSSVSLSLFALSCAGVLIVAASSFLNNDAGDARQRHQTVGIVVNAFLKLWGQQRRDYHFPCFRQF